MKIFLLVFAFLSTFVVGNTQNCTTMWPYLYSDFTAGTIYFSTGSKLEAKVNIHVQESALHFLDKDVIKEAASKDVVLVEIGNDRFYSKDGYMMKVLKSNDKGFVGVVQLGDFNSINVEGTSAYGASSNSSSIRKLSSIEIGGKTNTNHMLIKQNKDDGYNVPIVKSYYIVTKGEVYPASKKEVEKRLDKTGKENLKTFLKKNKIQWKNPDSLMLLIDFFN